MTTRHSVYPDEETIERIKKIEGKAKWSISKIYKEGVEVLYKSLFNPKKHD